MARSRNIKPGFFKNEDLAECTPWARLCFAGLWLLADREGRLEDRPKRIKAELFPFDSIEADPLLRELEQAGFIVRYQAACLRVIQITGFAKHQNPHHREPPSVLPAIPGRETPGPTQPQKPPEPRKAQALASCNGSKAQESPGFTPQEATCKGGLAVLIPDSGFLIPEEVSDGDKSPSSSPTTATEPAAPAAPAPRTPDCPFEDIVAAYNEILPELPRVIAINDDRKRAMRKAWKFVLTSKRSDGQRRAETPEQALDWLREFFRRARGNDFVMGRTPRGPGHEGWEADLDYLLTDRGMTRVLEKTNVATA